MTLLQYPVQAKQSHCLKQSLHLSNISSTVKGQWDPEHTGKYNKPHSQCM